MGNGTLHELLMTVESQGEAMGGSEERARQHFARAVQVQKGRSPGPYLGLALGLSSRPEAVAVVVSIQQAVLHVARATLPMLLVLAIAVLLVTYVPWLTLGLLR